MWQGNHLANECRCKWNQRFTLEICQHLELGRSGETSNKNWKGTASEIGGKPRRYTFWGLGEGFVQ